MMFIVRSTGEQPAVPDIQVKLSRKAPPSVPEAAGKTDFFCTGDAAAMAAMRAASWTVVELHDGYYEDGSGGGVGIWGQGKYWEIRDTHFTVKEAVGPTAQTSGSAAQGERVEVRRAIFGV